MGYIANVPVEMVEKIKVLLPFTPVDLVMSIVDYWGATKERCELADNLLNQYAPQIRQSGS